MLENLFALSVSPLNLVIRTIAVYIVVLALLRIAGRRQIAQLGPTELVAMLLISNAVQNSMNAGDNSLVGGLISATVLVVLSRVISSLTYRSNTMSTIIEGKPITLVVDGTLQLHQLKEVLMTAPQLKSLLMLQGVDDLSSLQKVIMDAEGRLIVTHKGSKIDSE